MHSSRCTDRAQPQSECAGGDVIVKHRQNPILFHAPTAPSKMTAGRKGGSLSVHLRGKYTLIKYKLHLNLLIYLQYNLSNVHLDDCGRLEVG